MRRNIAELHSGERLIEEPKSAAGKRTVAIPAVILDDLSAHRTAFAEHGADGPEAGSRLERARSGHVGRIANQQQLRASPENRSPTWP
ncbi:hypothetical protein ACWGLO_04680 [Streptomyces niveus]